MTVLCSSTLDLWCSSVIPSHSMVVLCICYGLSPLKTIYKDFVHFHFQFEVDFTVNDNKVKNV